MNTRLALCIFVAGLLLFVATSRAIADCLIPCPGDLNDNCKVDLQDFLVLARNWLTDCSPPSELPVLVVTDVGLSPQQAEGLAQLLRIPRELLVIEEGLPLLFVDPENHLALPTVPVEDQELIQMLLRDNQADDEDAIVFEAIDEAVVMVPVGPGGILGGYNDYFWGKGPVSVDLRGSNIRGFWRQVYK